MKTSFWMNETLHYQLLVMDSSYSSKIPMIVGSSYLLIITFILNSAGFKVGLPDAYPQRDILQLLNAALELSRKGMIYTLFWFQVFVIKGKIY
jgi:hypothetical protein